MCIAAHTLSQSRITFSGCRPHSFSFLAQKLAEAGNTVKFAKVSSYSVCGKYSSAPDKIPAPFTFHLTCAEEMLYRYRRVFERSVNSRVQLESLIYSGYS